MSDFYDTYSTTSGSLFYSDSDRGNYNSKKNAPINPSSTSRDDYWGRSGRYGDHRTLQAKDHCETNYLVHSPGTQYQHAKLLSQAIKPKRNSQPAIATTTTTASNNNNNIGNPINRTTPMFPTRSASALNSRTSIPTATSTMNNSSKNAGGRYYFPEQQQTITIHPQTSRGNNSNLFGIAPQNYNNERSGSAPVFIPLRSASSTSTKGIPVSSRNNNKNDIPAASARPLNENIARLMFGSNSNTNQPQFRSSRNVLRQQIHAQNDNGSFSRSNYNSNNDNNFEEPIVSVLGQYSEDTRQEIEDERTHLLEMKRKFQELKEALRRSQFEKMQREQKELDDREAEEELRKQRSDREKQLKVINQMRRLETENTPDKSQRRNNAPPPPSASDSSPSPSPRATQITSSWSRLRNQVVAGGATETQEPVVDSKGSQMFNPSFHPSLKIGIDDISKNFDALVQNNKNNSIVEGGRNNNSTMMISAINNNNNIDKSSERKALFKDPMSPPALQGSAASSPNKMVSIRKLSPPSSSSSSPSPTVAKDQQQSYSSLQQQQQQPNKENSKNIFLAAVQTHKKQQQQQLPEERQVLEVEDQYDFSMTSTSSSAKSLPNQIYQNARPLHQHEQDGDELENTSRPSESEQRRQRNTADLKNNEDVDDEPIIAAYTPPRYGNNNIKSSQARRQLAQVFNQSSSPPPAEVSLYDEDITTLDIATCAEGLVRYALHQKQQHQQPQQQQQQQLQHNHVKFDNENNGNHGTVMESAARFHPLLRNQQNQNYANSRNRSASAQNTLENNNDRHDARSRSRSQNNDNNQSRSRSASNAIISPEDDDQLRERQEEESRKRLSGKKQMVLYQTGIASLNAAEYDFLNKDATQLISNCWASALAHLSARFLTEHKCVARILIELHKRLTKEAVRGPTIGNNINNDNNITRKNNTTRNESSFDLPPLSPTPIGKLRNQSTHAKGDDNESNDGDAVVVVKTPPSKIVLRSEEY